jgi:hypothetical protein
MVYPLKYMIMEENYMVYSLAYPNLFGIKGFVVVFSNLIGTLPSCNNNLNLILSCVSCPK